MPIQKSKNEIFFKKWSPEMAYVLGFFAADGSMTKNKRGAHFIEFYITDRDLLIKIRKLIGSNHKISVRNRKGNWKAAYRLQIGSEKIFGDLLLLGMTPKKSKTLKLPKVPDEYFAHFIRGYFDGDGNVYANEYRRKNKNKKRVTLLSGFTSGSKRFLKKLHKKLKEVSHLSGGTLFESSGAHHLYYSVKDSCKLYEFMYNTKSRLYLKKKKKVFDRYFSKRERVSVDR